MNLTLEQIQQLQTSLDNTNKAEQNPLPDIPIATVSEDGSLVNATLAAVDRAIVRTAIEEGYRAHLGMSRIGDEDSRTIWLQWRWFLPEIDDARVYRIFSIGDAVEERLIEYLRQVQKQDVGVLRGDTSPAFEFHTVDPRTNLQIRFRDIGGHFAGSADGFIKGLPESPNMWHLFEAKSAKDSRFNEFKSQGIAEVEPAYWVQLHCYMYYGNVERALWVCENKDTSELLMYRVKKKTEVAKLARQKAEGIINSEVPPPSIYPSRNYYKIKKFKSEEYQAIYWGDAMPEEKNCRTCKYSKPVTDQPGGVWVCTKQAMKLELAAQHEGCDKHQFITIKENTIIR